MLREAYGRDDAILRPRSECSRSRSRSPRFLRGSPIRRERSALRGAKCQRPYLPVRCKSVSLRPSSQNLASKAPEMRSYSLLMLALVARGVSAQEPAQHVATKSTPIRTAPVNGTAVTPAIGQLAKGATVEVIAQER